MDTLKLKRHESFSLRDGWIEKYFQSLSEGKENIFSKNNGISILGIGSNMVKSLKFWLIASNIIQTDAKSSLTEFGNLLYQHDKYLEKTSSLCLIHYFLTSMRNKEWTKIDNPIPSLFFNYFRSETFTKEEFKDFAIEFYKNLDIEFNAQSIDADISILMRMYSNDGYDINPEDNYSCPLAKLGLIEKKEKGEYQKKYNKHLSLNPLVVYYILFQNFGLTEFDLKESFTCNDSPALLFNFDKNTYTLFLMQLQKMGYVTINKTAGLDMVYLNKKIMLKDIFLSETEGN